MSTIQNAKVHFFSSGVNSGLKNKPALRKFIESIFKNEGIYLNSISYIFCTDKNVREINKKYLHHDFYTDVITFDLSSDNNKVMAEVYISIDRIRDNAEKLGVTKKSELHRVLFHAALHLCGYNDKTKKDIQIMRKKEDALLARFFAK